MWLDVLLAILAMAAVLFCLQLLVQRAANYSVPKMVTYMRQRLLG